MKKLLLINLSAIMMINLVAKGQNTIPDSLFGNNSRLQKFTPFGETGSNFILQPDGKIIFGGYDYDISQNDFHIDMLRFDECGFIDSTFDIDGYVHYKFDQRNIGNSYTMQPDAKIICAGMQAPSNSGSQQISFVSRFNADGSPDSSFNLTGTHALRYDPVSSGVFHTALVMQDERILCIGNCSGNINGGVNGAGAMRFLPDGTLDVTFSADGKAVFNSPAYSQYGKTKGHLLNTGNIVFTTYVFDGSFIEHFFTLQCDSTGVLDTTYGTGGFYYDPALVISGGRISVSALQTDSKLILAAVQNGGAGVEVVRLNTDGEIDTTFANNGRLNYLITGVTLSGMQVLSNNNILLMGSYAMGSGVGCGIMLHSDGSPDTTFGANGFRVFDLNNSAGTHSLDALLELPNGKWLAAGSPGDFIFMKFTNQSNVPHISLSGNVLSATGGDFYQWYHDSVIIPLANGNSYQVTQNGSYTVMATDSSGCNYLSDPFVINSAGIAENKQKGFSLFPNPANDLVFIQSNTGEIINEINITDALGRVVQHLKLKNNQENYSFSIYSMKKGIYFVKIITDMQEKWIRLIKD